MSEELMAAKDACPHRDFPLSVGKNNGQGVRRYHGLGFGNWDKFNSIPAHPQHKISDRFYLCIYASVEKYGLIRCSSKYIKRR